jgi:hypothetical protein
MMAGRGRGLEGRETVTKTKDLAAIVHRTSGTAKRTVTLSMEQITSQEEKSRPASRTIAKKPTSVCINDDEPDLIDRRRARRKPSMIA